MTDAQKKANGKYKKEKTDTLSINIPKGFKDSWKQEASERGMSLTELVVRAVEKYLSEN